MYLRDLMKIHVRRVSKSTFPQYDPDIWMAFIETMPSVHATSKELAIGKLVLGYPELFGVEIDERR